MRSKIHDISWSIVFIGLISFLIYSWYQFIIDALIPLTVKILFSSMVLGVLVGIATKPNKK